jgi:hypothetical protein
MTALSVATGCGGGKGGSGGPGSDAGSSDGGESTSTDASGSTGTDARTGAAADGAGTTGTDAGAMTANDGGGTTGTDSGAMLGGDGAGGVPGGQPGAGTTVSGCQIFPNDNPWNVAIDGPDVEIIHTYDSQLPQGTSSHPDFGDYTKNHYGIPYNVVDAEQLDEPTKFNLYASQSDPGPGGWVGTNPVTANASTGTTAYPFFGGMHIEGDPALGAAPGNQDQHGIVLQQGQTGCTSYEAWHCVASSSPPFVCANGAVFDLTSNALRPAGWTSADAAGLSILAGLVKYSEVQAGAVTHAIRVTFNSTQAGYIPPATHASGSFALGSAYPPMGLRLRLKATVATSSYLTASQVIMAAMKKYGLMVADIGSDWYFQGDSDDRWADMAPDGQDTLIDEMSGDFDNLTGADFEVVYTGDPVATGL